MKLTHDIKIANYNVSRVNSVNVTKSINQISDVATIKISLKAYNKGYFLPKKVERGAKVSIALGYDGDNAWEFDGYVQRIKNGKETEIICEDSAFLLRREIKNKQYKNTSIGAIMKDIVAQVPDINVSVSKTLSPLKYDKFTVKDATAYEALEKIKEGFDIHLFFRKNTLYAQLKYELLAGKVAYDFSENVEKVNLSYLKKDDIKVRVEVVGIDRTNKKVTVVVGDKDSNADKIKINRYNIMDEKMLKAIGEEEMEKYKIDGYKGTITTWLLPACSYGYTAKIKDSDYSDRDGEYHVDAVTTTYSDRGGNRKITLGKRIK